MPWSMRATSAVAGSQSLRSAKLAGVNRMMRAKIIAVETANIGIPFVASSGPSNLHSSDTLCSLKSGWLSSVGGND